MKALLFPLSFCIAVSAATVPQAQEVRDGSVWVTGGTVVLMDVNEMGDGSVNVVAITPSGWSNDAAGVAGAHSTGEVGTAISSGTMTTPTEEGDMQLKVVGGVLCRFVNGVWVPARKLKKSQVPGSFPDHSNGPGQGVDSLPWTLYDQVTMEWWRSQ